MKIFLQRVRQAGASSSRVSGIIFILAFLILSALFAARGPVQSNSAVVAVNAPAQQCPASTIFTASFTAHQSASAEVVQQWRDFITSLTPAGYDTVTISGTNDSVGRTLTDATIVPQIAAAMQSGTYGSWTVGAVTWAAGSGCGDGITLAANSAGDRAICSCENPGYVVRPDIGTGNANWGGVNTATCNGPSQTITVTFSGPGPATPACAAPPSNMISWWPAEGNGDDIISHNNLSLGPATFTTGKIGQAFSFDGSGFASAGRPSNLINLGNQVTIDGWINPSSSNSTERGGLFR